jgi:signal transduction histidine kinase
MEPHWLLLTTRSLEFFSQLLLALLLFVLTLYWQIAQYPQDAQRGARYLSLLLLSYLFCLGSLCLYFSLFSTDRFVAMLLNHSAVHWFLFSIVKFAYHFPDLPKTWAREERIVAWLVAGLALTQSAFGLFMLAQFTNGILPAQPSLIGPSEESGEPFRLIDLTGLLVVVWILAVLIRQHDRLVAPDAPRTLWYLRFFTPAGSRDARAVRSFVLIALFPLLLALALLLQHPLQISDYTLGYLASLLSLMGLISLSLVYVNYYIANASLVLQVTNIIVVLIVLLLNTTGITTVRALASAQHDNIVDTPAQRIAFQPQQNGSYLAQVQPIPPTTHSALVTLPAPEAADLGMAKIDLPFVFKFFGRPWSTLYSHPAGFLTFGTPQPLTQFTYSYGTTPAVFVAYQSIPDSAEIIHVQKYQMAVAANPRQVEIHWIYPENTAAGKAGQPAFRAILKAEGDVIIDHLAVPPVQIHPSLLLTWRWHWWSGIYTGQLQNEPRHVHWPDLQTYPLVTPGSLIENYQLPLRQMTHAILYPLAELTFLVICAAVGAIPLFLRVGFMQPLNQLLKAIHRTEAGDLNVQVPVNQNNEIGTITQSFNSLVTTQRKLLHNLDDQVKERTQKLALTNQELQQEIELRRSTQQDLEKLNAELDSRVQRRTHELAQSEERFRRVVTSIRDTVYALTLNPTTQTVVVDYMSPNLAWFVNAEHGQPPYLSAAWRQRCVASEDQELIQQHLESLMAGQDSQIEYRLLQPDGQPLWVQTDARCEQASSTQIYCFGVISNIAARKQLEQERAQREALQEMNRLRNEWLGNVSHDLRTPLGVLKTGITTLLAEDIIVPPEAQHFVLRQLSNETDRLGQLIETLLDLSQLQSSALRLTYAQIDLARLLTELIEQTQTQIDLGVLPPFTLNLQITDPPLTLQADGPRIQQVLHNLLTNAIKFSPDYSQIQLRAWAEEDFVYLQVIDQGIGIAEHNFEQIFERYIQVHHPDQRSHNGIGLGLTICREIVRAHHGTITLVSRTAKDFPGTSGTTFTVQLPRFAPLQNP